MYIIIYYIYIYYIGRFRKIGKLKEKTVRIILYKIYEFINYNLQEDLKYVLIYGLYK